MVVVVAAVVHGGSPGGPDGPGDRVSSFSSRSF